MSCCLRTTRVRLGQQRLTWYVVCMLALMLMPVKCADAQAYFAGGPNHWRPGGGYNNPNYSNKGPTYEQVAADKFIQGGVSQASFFFDQLYGIAQMASYAASMGNYVLPNPTTPHPINENFDRQCSENGYWNATGGHLGTTLYNATPYKLGNNIMEALIEDLGPETNGTQFGGKFAELTGGATVGALLTGGVAATGRPAVAIVGRVPGMIGSRPWFGRPVPPEFRPMFKAYPELESNPWFYRATGEQFLFQDASGQWYAGPNPNSIARIIKPGCKKAMEASDVPGLNVTVSPMNLYGGSSSVFIRFTLQDLLQSNPGAQFFRDISAINPTAVYLGFEKPIPVQLVPRPVP